MKESTYPLIEKLSDRSINNIIGNLKSLSEDERLVELWDIHAQYPDDDQGDLKIKKILSSFPEDMDKLFKFIEFYFTENKYNLNPNLYPKFIRVFLMTLSNG